MLYKKGIAVPEWSAPGKQHGKNSAEISLRQFRKLLRGTGTSVLVTHHALAFSVIIDESANPRIQRSTHQPMEQEYIDYLRASYAADLKAQRGFVHYAFSDGTGATTAHHSEGVAPEYADLDFVDDGFQDRVDHLKAIEPELAASHGGVARVTVSAFRVPVRDAAVRTAVREEFDGAAADQKE